MKIIHNFPFRELAVRSLHTQVFVSGNRKSLLLEILVPSWIKVKLLFATIFIRIKILAVALA